MSHHVPPVDLSEEPDLDPGLGGGDNLCGVLLSGFGVITIVGGAFMGLLYSGREEMPGSGMGIKISAPGLKEQRSESDNWGVTSTGERGPCDGGDLS